MRWWVHQLYLVRKGLSVTKLVWLPPPRLKGRTIEDGVSFIAETSHAPFASHHCVKISVDEPIRERKPDNTLEGWIAYGDIREFEQIPLHRPRREEVTEDASPLPENITNPQDRPTSSTHPQQQLTSSPAPRTIHLSPSLMIRSRARAQASPQEGTTATASLVLATATPQLENHQSPPSKGKQVIVKESSEGDSDGEGSTSSSGHTISDENETEGENQYDDYEEGEVDISGEDNIIAKDIPVDEGHILPTSEAVPIKTSRIAREEEDKPLDYGEYGYSPCDHVANTEADNTSPIDLPPVIPAASPRFSMPPRAVAREIAFPVESTDLPTPTTIDSSTKARAPSFAKMVELDPSLVKETQLLTVSAPAEGNLPQSAIIEMFKDPDQWSDLAVTLDVLDSAAWMAKVNVSSVRDALLRFHNSITVLSSTKTAIVSPKILEYRKQLAYSKEKVSQIAPIIFRHDQEQLSLREQLKTFANNKTTIQDRITLLKQEIAQLEKQSLEEDLNI
ncbi:uncharacterized protein LOC131249594 [Magnolia sinica]|uniref:uncharacterized protein LOC131249594 n=1 Tax=Magnolia sinica TaxID=86752 RepID=UPI002659EA6E|nr:uncharacterized protein LOC131249594 [Magnolia sinica]